MFAAIFVLCSAVALTSSAPSVWRSDDGYKVVCYVGTWANYRTGDGKFLIEDIDAKLCTHLVYGFAKLSEQNTIAAFDPYLDLEEEWGLGAYKRFQALKQQNANLKTLIAIGGWNEGSTKYSQMASNAQSRKTFVDSVLAFVKKYGFDGLDVDWEYPANRGGIPEDKQNFIHLLKDLKEAMGPQHLLLTAAVSAGQGTIDTAYDIPGMSKYLDFINVMAYDLHGSWENTAGHNAPLHGNEGDALTVDYAINYWMKKGAPAKKLILGMGLYGRSFTLANAGNNGLGAPTTGAGSAGPITKEPGMLGYNEICIFLEKDGWQSKTDDTIQSPYAFKDNQWVGYDDIASINKKVDYLKSKGLGGGMVWSLETDDFKGLCGGGKYPLLAAINSRLGKEIPPTPKPTRKPTPGPGHSSTVSTPTPDDGELPCPSQGMFRHPKDCAKFYQCAGSGDPNPSVTECPSGTKFDTNISNCNYEDQVQC